MSGYIGPLPVPQGIQNKETFTATAGQTTFNTNGYTDGAFISVYLNGVRLINGTDYTATNGSDIVLTSAASASDVLDFETFNSFSLASQQFENITTKNPTHEDTDGGRESAISFKGEQSGGEISTLAQIQASHDGTADDQKGDLIFKTNDGSDNNAPTEAMRIDSSRKVGIGLTNAGDYYADNLVVNAPSEGGITIAASANTHNNYLMFADGTTGSEAYRGYILYEHGASPEGMGLISYGRMRFYTSANGTSATERWRIEENGNLKAVVNGNGIDFSAVENTTSGTSVSSSILDDYEEGSWTPTCTGALSVAGARYVKIGNYVNLSFYITSINPTADDNVFKITGLPYAVKTSGGYYVGGSIGYTGQNDLNDVTILTGTTLSHLYFHLNDGDHGAITGNEFRAKGLNGNSLDAMIASISYCTG